jgi:hypothetical protein
MRATLRVLLILASVVMLLGVASCSALNANDPAEVQIRLIGITPVGGVAYLQAGHDYDVAADTLNRDGRLLAQYSSYDDYEWASNDTNVAFMRGNVQTVRASHVGNCTITATLKGEGIAGTLQVSVE